MGLIDILFRLIIFEGRLCESAKRGGSNSAGTGLLNTARAPALFAVVHGPAARFHVFTAMLNQIMRTKTEQAQMLR